MRTIGILNSGGDCPGLNAVIEGVCGAASLRGWKTLGFYDGFEGLLALDRHVELTPALVKGLRKQGGTMLGTVNKGNFSSKVGVGQAGEIEEKVLNIAKKTLAALQVDGLVVVGGDGSQTTSLFLQNQGINVVGVPKTIDNDLNATEFTFGFDSAVSVVSEALDRLQTTANAHKRIMVVEVMGRHAGWIALHGGLAGGADVILLPEIEFSLQRCAEHIKALRGGGLRDILVVVAEGAKVEQGQFFVETSGKSESRLGGIGNYVSSRLEELCGIESRCCVLGHVQRGGSPSAFDRVLGVRFGAYAVELLAQRKFGYMAALRDNTMQGVALAEAVSKLKNVCAEQDIVHAAQAVGVYFGS